MQGVRRAEQAGLSGLLLPTWELVGLIDNLSYRALKPSPRRTLRDFHSLFEKQHPLSYKLPVTPVVSGSQ